MTESHLIGLCILVYMASWLLYLLHVAFRKKALALAGDIVALAGVILQTLSIGMRWVESYRMGIGHAPLSNLYESMVETGQTQFGISAMLKVWTVTGVLLVVGTVYAGGRAWLETQKLGVLVQEKQQLAAQLEGLSEKASTWGQDPALVAGVEKLEAELESKGRLRDALLNEAAGARAGFSPFLLGLARRHVRGLWLRQIVINTAENTLDLKGSALVPEAVPEFLEVPSEEPAFSGREFKTFGLKLGSDEAPVINFILSTEEGQEL